MSTSSSKPMPSTPVQVPPSSRRRTPPLGRNLSKRSPRHQKTILASSPPSYSFPSPSPSPTPTGISPFVKLDFGPPRIKDAFEMGEMMRAIEEVLLASVSGKQTSRNVVGGESKMRMKGKRKAASEEMIWGPRVRTGIKDLPDELLLKIFSGLHDQYGFRPLQTANGPEWYIPPLRVALVCRRWLPLTRQLFYRTISIHHAGRITSLHKTLSNPDCASLVRRISIKLPVPVVESLDEVPDFPMWTREADDSSDNEAGFSLSPKEMLRAILHSCPHLLRMDISGVSPSSLISPSHTSLATSLRHLHQLRFQSVSSLSLSSAVGGLSITAIEVRAALLGLSGLRHLGITGYTHSETPLDLCTPTRTPSGFLARPLPTRARALRLRTLRLIDSSFDLADLSTLLSHIFPNSLEELIIEQIHSPSTGFPPTLAFLPSLAPRLASLKILRAGLYNYTSSTTSHTIDLVLPHLPELEVLDIGGNVCSPGVLSLLPPTLTTLRLRGTPTLSANLVRNFLVSLAAQKRSFGSVRIRRVAGVRASGGKALSVRAGEKGEKGGEWEECGGLKRLEVFGGATSGWGESGLVWGVQRACWEAGVVWRGW